MTPSARLRHDGLMVIDIDEADGDALLPKRITKNDMIYVTSQLAIMVDTGITLSQALSGIVEQETNPTLRRVLADLERVGRGRARFLGGAGPASETLRQHLYLLSQSQRSDRHARPDARPDSRLSPQGIGNAG